MFDIHTFDIYIEMNDIIRKHYHEVCTEKKKKETGTHGKKKYNSQPHNILDLVK
jgi:hypothetical protein